MENPSKSITSLLVYSSWNLVISCSMGSTLNDFLTCALEVVERTRESHPRNMEAYHDHAIPELPTEIIFTHILPRLPPNDLMK